MFQAKRRGAVYGIIALMLCVAVYLNWSYVKSPDDLLAADQASGSVSGEADAAATVSADAEPTSEANAAEALGVNDYFAQSRLSREKARDEAISILKETVDNDKADEKAKQEAGQKISALAENSVMEERVESLIKAKGYTEAVVFVGSDSVNVIVQAPEKGLQATDAAKIKDVVVSETGFKADAIKIVEAA